MTVFMYQHHNVLTWCVFVCTSCWRELRLEQREVKLSPRSIWLQPRTWTPSGLLGQASLSFYCSVNSTLLTDSKVHYSDITLLPSWPLIQRTTTPWLSPMHKENEPVSKHSEWASLESLLYFLHNIWSGFTEISRRWCCVWRTAVILPAHWRDTVWNKWWGGREDRHQSPWYKSP